MNNNHTGGGHHNGFFLGMAIGAGLVFLLGTDKGKKILKTITEEGFELAELFGEEEIEEVPVKKQVKNTISQEKIEEIVQEKPPSASSTSKPRSSVRRFFRGIPKK